MAFDWPTFLRQNDIPFVERGPNINSQQVGIKCPLCGQADPSEHMALPRRGLWWGCRRNKNHGGQQPHYLVQLLLGCSRDQAASVVGDLAPARDPDAGFADQIKRLIGSSATKADYVEPTVMQFPPEFRPLANRGMGQKFWNYLRERLYTDREIESLADIYRLQYATTGPYGYRLIVPVYGKTGLMSWTGRTISQREEIRYKSLSILDFKELPEAQRPNVINIHDMLLNEQDLHEGGDALVVAEGPFDAMRLDFYGYPQRVRSTCFFGKSLSSRQAVKLLNLAPAYHRKWVLLDEDAKIDALAVQSQLERGGFKIRMMSGGKDAAALPYEEVNRLISDL